MAVSLLLLLEQQNQNEMNEESATQMKDLKRLLFVGVFIVIEYINSYYLRVFHGNLFNRGRIEVHGIELVNSFVVYVEAFFVVLYFLLWHPYMRTSKNHKKTIMYIIFFCLAMSAFSVNSMIISGVEEGFTLSVCIQRTYRAFFLAGVLEEYVYREMIYTELKNWVSVRNARWIQGCLFCFVHSQKWIELFTTRNPEVLINLISLIFMGVICAIIKDKCRSIWPSIIFHWAADAGIYSLLAIGFIN